MNGFDCVNLYKFPFIKYFNVKLLKIVDIIVLSIFNIFLLKVFLKSNFKLCENLEMLVLKCLLLLIPTQTKLFYLDCSFTFGGVLLHYS